MCVCVFVCAWLQTARTRCGNFLLSEYTWPVFVALSISIISFPGLFGDFMAAPGFSILGDLWKQTNLNDSKVVQHWYAGSGLYLNLIYFVVYRCAFFCPSFFFSPSNFLEFSRLCESFVTRDAGV